jgi:hypothetical protein
MAIRDDVSVLTDRPQLTFSAIDQHLSDMNDSAPMVEIYALLAGAESAEWFRLEQSDASNSARIGERVVHAHFTTTSARLVVVWA